MKGQYRYLFFVAFGLGFGVFILSMIFKPKPPVTLTPKPPRVVDVISLAPLSLSPKITGFGRVEPKEGLVCIGAC